MCNLYSLTKPRNQLELRFDIGHNRSFAFDPLPAIFPGHTAPIIRLAEDGARELVPMSWGFVLPQAGKAPRRVTNARDDTVRRSAFWRESFETRRCLVPATSFCEPHGTRKPSSWHWFALSPERPPFAFPGLWRRWSGPIKKDGPPVSLDVYAFLTSPPNAIVATVNHERSPVVLVDDEAMQTWLTGAPEEAYTLVETPPADRLMIVREGFEKKDGA